MNPPHLFAGITNATSMPWNEIPDLAVEDLLTATAQSVETGARLCAWFALPTADHSVCVVAVLARDAENSLFVARSQPFHRHYPSLTPTCPQAHMFEREICEQFGVTPVGHPWLKPVRKNRGDAPQSGRFFKVSGEEVHEVAVGPVHAGIIEPGHFRFQCAGEEVIHLEIALGYQHRGLEESLVGGPHKTTLLRMEQVAGDASIAHATAYSTVMEALSGQEAPLRAQWLRALALELERLANHTGDLGALANDVAFLPTSAACGKLRGDFLNLTALICGNRFGRTLVTPGGCRQDLEPDRAASLSATLVKVLAEVDQAVAWLWDASSVRARFERIGIVSDVEAQQLGLVGPAARACGLVRDVRYDHPAGWYRFAQEPVAVWPGGDVFARARVRSLEIQRSGGFILDQLKAAPDGTVFENLTSRVPDSLAVALVESWRGEVCHAGITDASGELRHYKIVDPSFHNWPGLAQALRGQAISDFPICNKSFNLSYCGFDL